MDAGLDGTRSPAPPARRGGPPAMFRRRFSCLVLAVLAAPALAADGDDADMPLLIRKAIRLRPEEPLYWYYRALTYRGLGKDTEATRDARVAASLRRAGKARKDIPTELERIQGCLRTWLTENDRWRPDTTSR